MRHKTSLLFAGLLLFLLLSGCEKEIHFETDAPFITVTQSPAGLIEQERSFKRVMQVDTSGRLKLFAKSVGRLTIGSDAPVYEKQLTEEEVNEIQKSLINYDFFKLPEDVSTPSDDGTFWEVQVLTDEGKRVSGGLNPTNADFAIIADTVWEKVSNEAFHDWVEETAEYAKKQFEKNN